MKKGAEGTALRRMKIQKRTVHVPEDGSDHDFFPFFSPSRLQQEQDAPPPQLPRDAHPLQEEPPLQQESPFL
jgi:hypothetical protein